LRPERLFLHERKDDADLAGNVVEGVVHRRVYLGNSLFYEVDVGFAILRVRHENTFGARTYAAGEEVFVQWEPGSSKALAE
jgi:ABC-type Fe3+/spermidine/putrescine transport system ATPase subunit